MHAPGGQHVAASPADVAGWAEHFRTEWIAQYDYAGATARLVATVPARNEQRGHTGDELHRWGQGRLRVLFAAVRDEAWAGAPLVLQFSSVALGANADGWVRQMASAFCPREARLPPLRIVFPTTREVRDSLEGWMAGVSIPCSDSRPMRECLSKLESEERRRGRPEYRAALCAWRAGARARAVPHLKSFTRCHDAGEGVGDGSGSGGGSSSGRGSSSGGDAGGGGPRLPWAVVGSHNFSKAAWGELSADGRALRGTASYELSVLVLPPQGGAALDAARDAPLPHLPPAPYAAGDTCWATLWRSTSVTDGLPGGVAGNMGSTDHHGRTPDEYASGRLGGASQARPTAPLYPLLPAHAPPLSSPSDVCAHLRPSPGKPTPPRAVGGAPRRRRARPRRRRPDQPRSRRRL